MKRAVQGSASSCFFLHCLPLYRSLDHLAWSSVRHWRSLRCNSPSEEKPSASVLPSTPQDLRTGFRQFAALRSSDCQANRRLVRPGRMQALAGDGVSYVLGLPVFVLAVAVALPIPFGNIIPVTAICFMALGLIERDGLIVLLGLLLTVVALGVTFFLLQGAASLFASV